MALWLALCSAAAYAQTESTTEPALTYVRGEARALEERECGFEDLGHPKVMATLETRPALGGVYTGQAPAVYSWIPKDALVAVFGEQRLFDMGRRGAGHGACFEGKGGIEQAPVFQDRRPVADIWTVIARNEEEARSLVEALLHSYRENVARDLEKARARAAEFVPKIEEGQRTIADYESQIQQSEEECRRLGVADMTDEAIDSAVARFDQEQRLNQVDIAGLEASLASAKQRAGGGGELAQTLARIQVELDIQLVGKLARKDALARELQNLQSGHAARMHIRELRQKIDDVKKSLAVPEASLSRAEKEIEGLEGLANFTVTDNRVTMSPIAQTR
jgi:hypothetical protein